jgi:GTPase
VHFVQASLNNSQEECVELALSAGLDILTIVTAKRATPNPKYFVGTGKADELRCQVIALKADLVLFNHDLAPAQGRNLEKLLECRVIDRTELILDIFAQRARSFEGKLQVELAQLQHLSSCLVRGWTHLERQKGGIGLRGPGETQLETDRRLLAVRIKSIKKRLSKVASQRNQSRQARRKASVPTIALVGYTNAGKSTLFNHLTQADVYVEDQLFATLDPTLRRLQLSTMGEVVLADTVGFIRDLPHELVAAFRATLEEVCQADLLLHVIDMHHDQRDELHESVMQVITELGAEHVPMLMVYNKIDLKPDVQPRIDYQDANEPARVWVSAQTGDGLELLNQAITELLQQHRVHTTVTLPPEEGALRAKLYELGAVIEESSDDSGQIVLKIEINRVDYQRLFEHEK